MRYKPRHFHRPSHRAAREIGAAAVLAAGAIGIGGVAAFSAPVSANPSPAAPHTVTFDGNCGLLGLAARSVPNQSQLQVDSPGTVTVVNNLGCRAHMYVDGKRADAVGSGDQQSMPVAVGTTTIKMVPDGLGLIHSVKPATITASPASSDSPTPGTTSGTGSGQSGTNSGANSGSGSDSGHTSGTQGGTSNDTHRSGTQQSSPVPGRQPNGGASPKLNLHQPVARGAVPSKAAAPGAGSGTSGGGGEISSTALPQQHHQQQPVAQPRPVSSVGPANPTNILALIAAICLTGVGAAAIRTVLTQRRPDKAAGA